MPDDRPLAPVHISKVSALLHPHEIILSLGRYGVTMTPEGTVVNPPPVEWCFALTVSPMLLPELAELFTALAMQYGAPTAQPNQIN